MHVTLIHPTTINWASSVVATRCCCCAFVAALSLRNPLVWESNCFCLKLACFSSMFSAWRASTCGKVYQRYYSTDGISLGVVHQDLHIVKPRFPILSHLGHEFLQLLGSGIAKQQCSLGLLSLPISVARQPRKLCKPLPADRRCVK